MSIKEALAIVLELAEQNVLSPQDEDEENSAQCQRDAIAVINNRVYNRLPN